jgi:hypothetical protein
LQDALANSKYVSVVAALLGATAQPAATAATAPIRIPFRMK